MLKIAKDPVEFYWPVKVQEPDQNKPGQHVSREFLGKFVMVPNDKFIAMTGALDNARQGLASEFSANNIDALIEQDKQFVKGYFLGWKEGEIKDADGQDVPVSDDNIDFLLNIPGMSMAIQEAYNRARRGDAARKKT